MNLQTDHVLVTGAVGWLGSRLVQTLARGLADHEGLQQPDPRLRIRCLVLPGQDGCSLRKLSDRIEVTGGDLRNPTDCERWCAAAKDGLLFHTAGVIHPKRVSEFHQVNCQGTANLLQAACKAKMRRAIIMSSNSPFGCNPHPDHLFDEYSPYRPYLGYGRSKMQMERAVAQFQQSGQIETVIIRSPWFYGPNQPPRQTLFFKMIRDGKAPIVGSGENLRSMSYIDNLCQGLLLAAKRAEANGQAYWIADKRPYSMNEIVNTVEGLLENDFGQQCAHKRLRLPGVAGSMAFLADSLLQAVGMYHQKVHVLSEMNKTIACSVARAERELGYRPVIELAEGMRRSLAWCASQGIKF